MNEITNFNQEHAIDGKHRPSRSPVGFIGDVIEKQTTPPVSPNEEDAYLVIAIATGEFTGHENDIAYFRFGEWIFVTPETSCRIWIANENLMYRWFNTKWVVDLASYPENYICGLAPIWISISQVQIENGSCADDAGENIIQVTSPILVDITVIGLNGLDVAPETASTWYYLWVIKNISTNVVAGLLSISPTAPTLPTGFTAKRLLGAIRNDAGSNFLNFKTCGEGNVRTIYYIEDIDSVLQVLSGGNAIVWTPVSLVTLIPPIVRHAIIQSYVTSKDMWIRETGTTPATTHIQAGSNVDFQMLVSAAQSIDYYVLTGAGRAYLSIRGYCIVL